QLPLLQFALAELWDKDADKGVLTLKSYEQIGDRFHSGLHGVIAHQANQVIRDLDDRERGAIFRIFATLANPLQDDTTTGANFPYTSRRALQAELNDSAAQHVVEVLVNARLLIASVDAEGDPTIEVAHEALLRTWPGLPQWLKEQR